MRSVIQHLRLPFSLFLMPVYWFAISQSLNIVTQKAIWAFVILHFIIYPASNAYNSYFDKDEGPIGGIAKPLPVQLELYYVANSLDVLGIILSYIFCGEQFAMAIFIYVLVSKAYSHPIIRLKQYPILSWLVVGFFQGFFVYWSVYQTVTIEIEANISKIIFPALLSSINLWAFYPITQIYQHEEDAARGDNTLSLKLGIKGTFIFTAVLFLVSTIGFYFYFKKPGIILPLEFLLFAICMAPSLVFYNFWLMKSWTKSDNANFKNTMIMNILGSAGLNLFFIAILFWLKK